LALIKNSPLILKTILAVASRHATNTKFCPTILPHSGQLATNKPLASSESATRSLYQALSYKQAALAQLQFDLKYLKDLKDLKANRYEAIIASISIFVFLELLESGRDTWKIHLDGVKKLVLEDPHVGGPNASEMEFQAIVRTNQLIDPYLFDTCIM